MNLFSTLLISLVSAIVITYCIDLTIQFFNNEEQA